jgi:hypothetical protein
MRWQRKHRRHTMRPRIDQPSTEVADVLTEQLRDELPPRLNVP